MYTQRDKRDADADADLDAQHIDRHATFSCVKTNIRCGMAMCCLVLYMYMLCCTSIIDSISINLYDTIGTNNDTKPISYTHITQHSYTQHNITYQLTLTRRNTLQAAAHNTSRQDMPQQAHALTNTT